MLGVEKIGGAMTLCSLPYGDEQGGGYGMLGPYDILFSPPPPKEKMQQIHSECGKYQGIFCEIL